MYSSSSNLRKKSEVGNEPFLYDTHTNLLQNSLSRQQNHLLREFSTNEKHRSALMLRRVGGQLEGINIYVNRTGLVNIIFAEIYCTRIYNFLSVHTGT